MTSPMYTFAVPVFKQMLMALKAVLAQASAHATAHSIEPDALLQARLYPDMFALAKQVQIAADFARGVSARLAGVEIPTHEGQEKSFADLDSLLAQTVSFLDGLSASRFEGSESREIVLRPGTPKEKRLVGQTYLAGARMFGDVVERLLLRRSKPALGLTILRIHRYFAIGSGSSRSYSFLTTA
jgi:hypothetical protein